MAPDTGAALPAGKPGKIWTRSRHNMVGYWRDPVATAATITADGWLRTGDVGYFDADGYLYIHDRVKDMIISGGENIYPAEVENVIDALDQVLITDFLLDSFAFATFSSNLK